MVFLIFSSVLGVCVLLGVIQQNPMDTLRHRPGLAAAVFQSRHTLDTLETEEHTHTHLL